MSNKEYILKRSRTASFEIKIQYYIIFPGKTKQYHNRKKKFESIPNTITDKEAGKLTNNVVDKENFFSIRGSHLLKIFLTSSVKQTTYIPWLCLTFFFLFPPF